jgi:hypothetical protein
VGGANPIASGSLHRLAAGIRPHTAYGPGRRCGARPLSDLVSVFVAAGLVIDAIVELAEPTPHVLAISGHIDRMSATDYVLAS